MIIQYWCRQKKYCIGKRSSNTPPICTCYNTGLMNQTTPFPIPALDVLHLPRADDAIHPALGKEGRGLVHGSRDYFNTCTCRSMPLFYLARHQTLVTSSTLHRHELYSRESVATHIYRESCLAVPTQLACDEDITCCYTMFWAHDS